MADRFAIYGVALAGPVIGAAAVRRAIERDKSNYPKPRMRRQIPQALSQVVIAEISGRGLSPGLPFAVPR